MRSLANLMEETSAIDLEPHDIDRLHLLMADWSVLADLAAADLVLWLPTGNQSFVALGLCRAATSTTVHMEDIVGLHASQARAESLAEAFESGQIAESMGVNWAGSYSMSITCIPVFNEGRCIAVLSREANFSSPSNSASSDMWTSRAADILCEMITRGEYPYDSTPNVSSHGVPRVNDGAMLVDTEGVVIEVTPNANSCMKRIGIRHSLVGRTLIEDITEVVRDQTVIEETLAVVVMGRASWRAEVESPSATVTVRALPLTENGVRLGAVLLTRDVSEMRRREQELMTKDATIREIHHRVKNNLQTVSALLRMQSRRTQSSEVKEALREAGRRVETIATVHEALSHNVDEIVHFDAVASSILRMAGSVATTDHAVNVVVEGQFGDIPADAASALATVLAELVTNSVEHGLADRDGTVRVIAQRSGESLFVVVADDGVGIEPGTPMTGLGTQIVHMMVRGELKGSIEWEQGEAGGTIVSLKLNIGND